MRSLRKLGKVAALPVALGASIAAALTAFACTLLPSLDLNQTYGAAGADILVTGSAWTVQAPVTLHWDTLNGPVLATISPAPGTGLIGPVTIHVPANAQPGYHVIVGTDNAYSTSTARVPFQVLGSGPAGAGSAPQVEFSNVGNSNAPVGVGVLALLAVAGAGGLAVAGAGAGMLVRTRTQQQVRVRTRATPRQR